MRPRIWATPRSSSSRPRSRPTIPSSRPPAPAALPVVRRAEMLAELMRLKRTVAVAGTHGKTTTTSMIAALLDAGGLDPTVINGGIINAYGSNARLGKGDWMVVEADESDGSFLRLTAPSRSSPTSIPSISNITAASSGQGRVRRVRRERAVLRPRRAVHRSSRGAERSIGRIRDRRVVTYGFSPQADVRAVQPRRRGRRRDLRRRDPRQERRGRAPRSSEVQLSLPGRHNVQNALAAIAVALELGIPDEVVRRTFAGFEGVKRRFTRTGEVDGAAIIDDYAHHPVEIRAVLRPPATAPRAGSSPSCSRTATPGCRA